MAGIAELALSPAFLIYPPLLFLIRNAVVFVLDTLRPKIDRTFPFLTYGAWAKEYGKDTPLGFKKGAAKVFVLNSGRLVRELFERHGAVYNDRPWQFMNNTWVFRDDLRAAISQNSSPWLARWRREFTNNFGTAAIARLRPVYEAETARLLVKLFESPTAKGEDLEAILVCWMMSVPCLGVCGRRPDHMDDHGFTIKQFRHCSDEERARAVKEGVMKTGTHFLHAAKDKRAVLDAGRSVAWESVLAKMLREQREKNDHMFTVKNIGNTAFHIVSATTNALLAVLEMSGGATPKAIDIPNLKYTDAFWNEIHRWRPVAPQGVAHAPSQDDFYDGHHIPKGTAVIMNVWNIHYSEEDYKELEKFILERFLHHPFRMRLDQAHDPAHMEASSARITYDFEARGYGKEIDLTLETRFIQEIALHPKDFDVVLKMREGCTKEDIMDHYSQTCEAEAVMMGWEDALYK
ncbi:cytochrome P450 [Xylariaceae sp. FL1651]|nr:cytochrome P450 [Xylariaceae sp. FL1651]